MHFKQLSSKGQILFSNICRRSQSVSNVKHPGRNVGPLTFHGFDLSSHLPKLALLLTLLILEIVLATLEVFAEVRCLENSLPSSFCQVSKSSWTVGQSPTHSPTRGGRLAALLQTIPLVEL